jgi:hypothetical protein
MRRVSLSPRVRVKVRVRDRDRDRVRVRVRVRVRDRVTLCALTHSHCVSSGLKTLHIRVVLEGGPTQLTAKCSNL